MIVGIDEVGRGPLAGPVAVGIVATKPDFDFTVLGDVKDSKKLSEKKREEIFEKAEVLKASGEISYGVFMESAQTIDKIGIVPSLKRAIKRGLKNLSTDVEVEVFLDGGLVAPAEYKQKTIIKGDEKVPIISLASILAKVTRDRYIKSIAEQYKEYGFDKHKGYGTKAHREMIEKYGLSDLHRKSFCKNYQT